jgi:tRNA nucleotidyltransferase (CCA-adding enzyme)
VNEIRVPGAVIDVVRRLQERGHHAWCVGGAVRDALLGHVGLDWDIATSATPPEVQRLFERTIPVGLEFGTVGVFDRAGRMHEVTTFRHDVEHDGRHAKVRFGASIDEDLARRDFTINAIAFDPIAKRLYDPFAGRADLAAGIVRTVGPPDDRFTEDRLRALRALRFAARFGFDIDGDTWHAVMRAAPFLPRLSPERVKQELEKTVEQVPRASRAFVLWRASGAFAAVVPALADVRDEVLHAVDCLPHRALPRRPLRRTLRLAVLFSDNAGEHAAASWKALRFSNADIAIVKAVADQWHESGPLLRDAVGAEGAHARGRTLRQFIARAGRLRAASIFRVVCARWAVSAAPPAARDTRAMYRALLESAFRDPVAIGDLALDGEDLRRLGVPNGPEIGRTLHRLLTFVVDDPSRNDSAQLSAEVQRWRGEAHG